MSRRGHLVIQVSVEIRLHTPKGVVVTLDTGHHQRTFE